MKRIHIGLRVDDLASSQRFYSALFGVEPTVAKDDYAKWMLDDPRVNFSISTRCDTVGNIHLGIQVEDEVGLSEVTDRLKQAGLGARETPGVSCCYARSDKTWTADPQGIPWETFLTREGITRYGEERLTQEDVEALQSKSCCN